MQYKLTLQMIARLKAQPQTPENKYKIQKLQQELDNYEK